MSNEDSVHFDVLADDINRSRLSVQSREAQAFYRQTLFAIEYPLRNDITATQFVSVVWAMERPRPDCELKVEEKQLGDLTDRLV